jgi:hypothetical protein
VPGARLLALFLPLALWFAVPGLAHAAVHNLVPANQAEEPTESFRADEALFFYATSDIKGGRVCIVPAEGEMEELSCESPAWGSPNTVGGIGTIFSVAEAPYLRVGSWRLLGETIADEENDAEPTAISAPFTVSPCGAGCDPTLGSDAVTAFKSAAQGRFGAYYVACAAMVLHAGFKELNS